MRLRTISVVLLFPLISLAAILTAADDENEVAKTDVIRLAVSYELQSRHFKWWEGDEQRRQFIEQLSGDLLSDDLSHEWKFEFWATSPALKNLTSPPVNLDQQDKDSIEALASGAKMISRISDDGRATYYTAIGVRSCLTCHGPLKGVTPDIERTLPLAYVKVKAADR